MLAAAAVSFAVGLGAAVLLHAVGGLGGAALILVGAGLLVGARAIRARALSAPAPQPLPVTPAPQPLPVMPAPVMSRPAGGGAPMSESPPPRIAPPGADLVVATVVHTDAELHAMLGDKPPCWRYAAFVSVLVQRRDAVRSRLLDARTGFARPGTETVHGTLQAGLFFTDRFEELWRFIDQIDDFMLSPAFREIFGGAFDEDTADAAGIVQAAHRLMDYHDGLLSLCERCRAVTVPAECRDLQRDFGLLTALPLEGFERFIGDFTERVAEMGDVARFATGNVELDPVELGVRDYGDLLATVSRQLRRFTTA